MLDFRLTPEQEELRARAREFALREVLPASAFYDQRNTVPVEILRKAFDAGLINVDIPTAYGGRGAGTHRDSRHH